MTNVVVPSVGESITEVSVSKFLVPEGGYVEKDAPIFEIESDKASVEVPAPLAGIVHYSVKEGETLKVGATVCSVISGQAPITKQAPPTKVEEPLVFPKGARKTADQFLQELTKKEEEPKQPVTKKEETKREPLSKIRKTIAKRLVQVKNETAMLTTFNEVDLSEIVAIRNREKEKFFEKHGVKLTYLPFFVKAAALVLQEFPEVNAFIDGDDIVYNQHSHIAIAVSTDTGLVVPVIKQVDTLSFVEIAKAIQENATKARDRKLSISDMINGTFTITNGGVFGSMLSTPILNPPQSAILGMHNIVDRPVAIKGEVVIRPIMYLALSYDHRIIDGKESVSFLVRIKEILENPIKMLLQ